MDVIAMELFKELQLKNCTNIILTDDLTHRICTGESHNCQGHSSPQNQKKTNNKLYFCKEQEAYNSLNNYN